MSTADKPSVQKMTGFSKGKSCAGDENIFCQSLILQTNIWIVFLRKFPGNLKLGSLQIN